MINELTPEQEAQIQVYFDKYLQLGLNTNPTNDEVLTIAAKLFYKLNNLTEPQVFIFDSPNKCFEKIAELDGKPKAEFVSTWFAGTFDSYWLCFYSYLIEVLELDIDKDLLAKFEAFKAVSKECNFWYPYEGVVLFTRKPKVIHLDAAGNLHNIHEKAIQFRDGYGGYYVHGFNVPEWIVKDKHLITLNKINEEKNAETRRIMIDFFGNDRYLLESNFKVLDEDIDPSGRPRRLLMIEVEGDEDILRVEVVNSSPELDKSFRKYYLPVDPECRPILKDDVLADVLTDVVLTREEMIKQGYLGEPQKRTCHNAVASTFGKKGEEWGLPGQIRQGDVFVEMKTGKSSHTPFRES